MNPFDAIATLVLGRIKDGLYARWLRFLFELVFSGTVTFLFTCGSVLIGTRSASLGIGSGLVAAAISLTVLFRRESTSLTKGMLVVLPGAEATKELETDLQVIQKGK